MNRRKLIMSAAGVAASFTVLSEPPALAWQAIVPLTKTNKYSPAPTASKYPIIKVDPSVIVVSPWKLEGKQIQFYGVVDQRLETKKGYGYEVGPDNGVYASVLKVTTPGVGVLLIASNLDLAPLKDLKTVFITGMFGGEADVKSDDGGIYPMPLIIASSLEDPRKATPVA